MLDYFMIVLFGLDIFWRWERKGFVFEINGYFYVNYFGMNLLDVSYKDIRRRDLY